MREAVRNNLAGTPVWVLSGSIDMEYDIGGSPKKLNINKILTHPKLEGAVANSIGTARVTNLQSIAIRSRIVQILELLDSEIKT